MAYTYIVLVLKEREDTKRIHRICK